MFKFKAVIYNLLVIDLKAKTYCKKKILPQKHHRRQYYSNISLIYAHCVHRKIA